MENPDHDFLPTKLITEVEVEVDRLIAGTIDKKIAVTNLCRLFDRQLKSEVDRAQRVLRKKLMDVLGEN